MSEKKTMTSRLLRVLSETEKLHERGEIPRGSKGQKRDDGGGEGEDNPFELLFRKSLDVQLLMGVPGGKILHVSDSIERILGYAPDELIGKHGSVLHPPSTHPDAENLLDRIKDFSPVLSDDPFYTKNGKVVSMDLTARIVRWQGGTAVFVTLRDNTKRLAFEKEKDRIIKDLTEAQATIEKMQELLPVCAHCKRIRDDGKDTWVTLERYVTAHSRARFSHSLCPDCLAHHYPSYSRRIHDEMEKETEEKRGQRRAPDTAPGEGPVTKGQATDPNGAPGGEKE